ncbi:hypothetical protein [Streptomyces sp. NPDC002588]
MAGAAVYHARAGDSAKNTSVPAVLGLLTLAAGAAALMA